MKFYPLPWGLRALIFAAVASADSLPYTPTRLLTAANSSFAYVLQPSSQSPNQGILRAVDVTKEFAIGSLPGTIVQDTLPFLSDGEPVPYTPVVDESGNVTVIAGSCAAGANGTVLWRFERNNDRQDGSGIWTQHQTSDRRLTPGSNLTGSNFLAGAVAFSSRVGDKEADMGFYMFGGMCPFQESDAVGWVNDAAYSNNMLAFNGQGTEAGGLTYDISSIANRDPAIAEAGFSMTGLSPSYSMNPNGGVQSRQQDFLLIGGHTKQAFINMSNVAMFSLPQESWAFVPVQQPLAAKTDLAVRQGTSFVEPRSGHTAVLSEDGGSVIVLGGWVGDITNPAQPQLAVLHLGSEYGGDESVQWTWSVPRSTGTSTPAADGLYGHGAAMLPGGVMMVVGGYTISSSSSRRTKRASQVTNDGVFLFNTTSNTWIDSYTPPASAAMAAMDESSGPLSKTSQQAGLGAGLGVAALALACLACFGFFYARRLKERRDERRQELLSDHSSLGSFTQIDQPYMDRGGFDGRGGAEFASNQRSPGEMRQTGTTGLFVNAPGPTRGFRKVLPGRPYAYHTAPRYDERRLNQGNGNIHPIMEAADEDISVRNSEERAPEPSVVQRLKRVFSSNSDDPERSLRELHRAHQAPRTPSPLKDPFMDPEPNPLGSHPVSPADGLRQGDTIRRVPTNASRRESPTRQRLSAEVESSMNWTIVEQLQDYPESSSSSSNGRASPTKTDDRTSSTLSDRSHRSQASSLSFTRTMSTRTGAVLAAALAAQNRAVQQHVPGADRTRSYYDEQTSTLGTTISNEGQSPTYLDEFVPYHTARSSVPRGPLHEMQKSADSFQTARTNFAQLQDEGQILLGGRPHIDRDDPYHRAMAATSLSLQPSPRQTGSPPLALRRGKGWIGSLRRALTAMSNSDRSFSLTASSTDAYDDEPGTSSSSPIRPRRKLRVDRQVAPRRAVSDGGALLLRQKRGQLDWLRDKDGHDDDWGEPPLVHGPSPHAGDDDDWDVEGEASKRDVQVMFTVPKTRLRVVNADVDRVSLRSASDGAASARLEGRSSAMEV